MNSRLHIALALPVLLAVSSQGATAQSFFDDIESYASGSNLDGQGGWRGWDGISQGLTSVSTAFAFDGNQSIALAPGGGSLQEFDLHSGQWIITTQVYIEGNNLGSHWVVFLDEYNDNGPYEQGARIEMSSSFGRVDCDCGGVGAFTATLVTDRWVEVRLELDLDLDTATAFYDGTAMGTWAWSSGWNGSGTSAPLGFEALNIWSPSATSDGYYDAIEVRPPVIGSSYCAAVANSSGTTGAMSASGSTAISANDVTLRASSLPQNAFGFFLTSQSQGFVLNPGGSTGNLCLGGSVGRYVGPGQVMNTGSTGTLRLLLDLTQTPTPMGLVAVMPGDTWNFQAWHRDFVGGSVTSNFTDGLSVDFQ